MKKFEVGERVQFIYAGKLRTGRINSFSTENGELYAHIEFDAGQVCVKVTASNIAKLDQPKPETLPKEVVDVIGGYEDTYDDPRDRLIILTNIVADCALFITGKAAANEWINGNKRKFIRAVLDGYVVEEEKKYYVHVVPREEGYLNLRTNCDGSIYYGLAGSSEVEGFQTKFTEEEIKAIDERLWAFAVPVVEVEAQ